MTVPKRWHRGTHRSLAPEETLQRARPHFSTLGITRVAMVTGLDHVGVPVAMAIRPGARSLVVSPGKGVDGVSARASAVMESLECWHAERPLVPLRRASMVDLAARARVVDVHRLPHVDARDFDPERVVLWAEGHDLLRDEPVWVPFECIHLDFTLPLPPSSGALMPGSNGLASGNDPAEALTHALHELIERDAHTLWHLHDDAARDRSRVSLADVDDPVCREVLARFEGAGLDVAAWEITSDVGVAAFRCEVLDRAPAPGETYLPGVGAGCHTDRAVALARALTEAAQTRLTLIAGARDDLRQDDYSAARDPEALRRARERMHAGGPLRRFADVPQRARESVDEDLLVTLHALVAAGAREVIAVDLTRPEIGVPVVRALVPGLEGIHDVPGYTPGDRATQRLVARGALL